MITLSLKKVKMIKTAWDPENVIKSVVLFMGPLLASKLIFFTTNTKKKAQEATDYTMSSLSTKLISCLSTINQAKLS